jgi:heme-degrading monooxygenase HmoA
MYAVVRETTYGPDEPLQDMPGFKKFQAVHAARPGYRGTIVTHLGAGRYIMATLWASEGEMDAAREALEPVVELELNPAMTAPSKLHGTGEVVFLDV